ncbi:MAG: CoA-binding protein [Deltaproteobacteria bacterium]|nr:CoA-binding protein [Deltaproteobacteria bacterium]
MTGRVLSSLDDVEPVLRACRVVAVLGCHREPAKPAHYVPAYLHERGRKILPVNPVFVGSALFGVDVRARLDELQEAVDVVVVFRRSAAVTTHLEEVLAMRPLPPVVWLQSGITNADVCARLRAAGIDTVEDRCMLADGRRLGL